MLSPFARRGAHAGDRRISGWYCPPLQTILRVVMFAAALPSGWNSAGPVFAVTTLAVNTTSTAVGGNTANVFSLMFPPGPGHKISLPEAGIAANHLRQCARPQ
jgi:hypothetical protein